MTEGELHYIEDDLDSPEAWLGDVDEVEAYLELHARFQAEQAE